MAEITFKQRAELRRLADSNYATPWYLRPLLDTIDALEAKLHTWNRAAADVGFAGSEYFDDPAAVFARVSDIKSGWLEAVKLRHESDRKIDALEASNAALEARATSAEQSLETLRLRAEVLYATASALLSDANAFCGVRDEAVGTEVKL